MKNQSRVSLFVSQIRSVGLNEPDGEKKWGVFQGARPYKWPKKNTVNGFHSLGLFHLYFSGLIWVFPKIGVPPNHEF